MQALRSVFLLVALAACSGVLHALAVCNAGVPGENSAQVLQRLPKVLTDCPHPDAVVLFIGMNDAVNEQRFQTPQQTFASVSAILKSITDVHARTFVVIVHMPDLVRLMQRHSPQSYGDHSPAQRIDEMNAALRRAAKEQGATSIEFHNVLAQAGGANAELSTDGVHLTAEGYHLLAVTVASALTLTDPSGTVLCLGDSLTYGTGVRGPNEPDGGSESYPQQLERLLRARDLKRTR